MYNQTIIGNMLDDTVYQMRLKLASCLHDIYLRLGVKPEEISSNEKHIVNIIDLNYDGQILEEYKYKNETLVRLLRQGNNFFLESCE